MGLLGGSQADSSRTYTHGFFHDGVKSTQFKVSNTYFLRILPAFDLSKMGTPGFEKSFVPYRSKELPDDFKTKTPGFTSWFYVVQAYTWYGKGTETFISPLSADQRRTGVDPIRDIRNYCERSDDPQIKALTVDKSFKERAPAPMTRLFGLVNILLMTDVNSKKTENQIGIFTNSAITDLKNKLSMRAGRNDEVISSDWEDYIYGDITHPVEGLAATVRETNPEGADNIRFSGVHFSDKPGRLEGHQKWDLSDTDALENRYNIVDEESVTKIWTYDQILEYVVQDGVIPYNVIEAACAPHAQNGIPTPTATVSVPSNHEIPSQIKDSASTDTEVKDIKGTPTPTPAPTPSPSILDSESTVVVSETDVTKTSTDDALTSEEREKYEQLSELFRKDPQSVPASDLPEYFALCSKAGVSPK